MTSLALLILLLSGLRPGSGVDPRIIFAVQGTFTPTFLIVFDLYKVLILRYTHQLCGKLALSSPRMCSRFLSLACGSFRNERLWSLLSLLSQLAIACSLQL